MKETISFELNEEECIALAQLIKRIGYTDLVSLSKSDTERLQMSDALYQLRRGLDEAGYSPR